MTRVVYIDPSGAKHYSRPSYLSVGTLCYCPPTDDQLKANGWQVITEDIPEPTPYVPTYSERVVALIREIYTIDDELAIQRQRETKTEEFAAYNAFCEECKSKAKEEV